MGLFDNLAGAEEGERVVVDIDPVTDRNRGVATFEADRVEAYDNLPVANEESGDRIGTIRETDDGDGLGLFQERQKGFGQKMADIRNPRRTDRNDLDPVGIGRDRNSGEFTPDNTMPAPRSPADRDPDDGEYVTPDPRPVTEIGRQERTGLFDLF